MALISLKTSWSDYHFQKLGVWRDDSKLLKHELERLPISKNWECGKMALSPLNTSWSDHAISIGHFEEGPTPK
eukprot:5365870-Amphidinium_carterae.1